MIKVLDEKEVPRAEIKCSNCDSLLEYGNADLYEDHCYETGVSAAWYAGKRHYFTCPVCGCKINASWISKG